MLSLAPYFSHKSHVGSSNEESCWKVWSLAPHLVGAPGKEQMSHAGAPTSILLTSLALQCGWGAAKHPS